MGRGGYFGARLAMRARLRKINFGGSLLLIHLRSALRHIRICISN